MEGIDVLLQQLSVRLSLWLDDPVALTSPLAQFEPVSLPPPTPPPFLSGVQTSQSVHGRGAGDDGEPLRRPVLLPHAASQSGPLPQRGGASAHESNAQVRLRYTVRNWRLSDPLMGIKMCNLQHILNVLNLFYVRPCDCICDWYCIRVWWSLHVPSKIFPRNSTLLQTFCAVC